MDKAQLELYNDYLPSTFGYVAAMGLSAMVNEQVSHDQVTCFLSAKEYTSKDLWDEVKPTAHQVEREDAVLIFQQHRPGKALQG